MKDKKRLEKILTTGLDTCQGEVSALIGAELKFSEPVFSLKTKENAFDDLLAKQILAKIDIRGDIEGQGCLLVNIKDAIRLGGILIMLPPTELDEVVADENYSEDTADSFGEIANIIAGAYSKAFEEMFPKSCRIIRKELDVFLPAKVDLESDEPVRNEMFFVATQQVIIEGNALGDMNLFLPAEALGLVEEAPQKKDDAEAENSVAVEEPTDIAAKTETDQTGPELEESTAEAQEQEESETKIVEYSAKNQAKIDKILDVATATLCDEVGALIGGELSFDELKYSLLEKEGFIDKLSGKQIVAKLDVRGDVEGQGGLFLGVKDAIRLGGTLIMLPQTELEECVGREEYNEEIEDSYGEIANIIAGSYSKAFEEMYPKICRVIRKELGVSVPTQIEVSSQEPIPDQYYYVATCQLQLNGLDMGAMSCLLPALTFGLLASDMIGVKPVVSGELAQDKDGITPTNESASKGDSVANLSSTTNSEFDTVKQRKLIDKLLDQSQNKIQDEITAMLGTEVLLAKESLSLVSKEDFFFDEVSGKQVMATFDMVGDDHDGSAFFFVGLKDAVRIGGILIMLPPNELENSVSDEEFTGDCQDAYGEITNIIAGVYTQIFEGQYTHNVRYIKKDLEVIAPMKVDADSNEPIENQHYYKQTLTLTIAGTLFGSINFLLPAETFKLAALLIAEQTNPTESVNESSTDTSSSITELNQFQKSGEVISNGVNEPRGFHNIIVIGNDDMEKNKLCEILNGKGFVVKDLTFNDNVYNYINDQIIAVFLVTKDVNEQAFGVAIKISTACQSPLIAAGSAWTRTKVLKAVKYGVKDILLTPASNDDIIEKIDSNQIKLAA